MNRILVFAAILSAMTTPAAFAANDSRANALFGVLGEEKQQSLAMNASGFYVYSLVAGRSYVAFCWQPGVEGAGSCDVETQDNAGTAVGVTITGEPRTVAGGHQGDAVALTPAATGTFYVKLTNTGPNTTLTDMIMIETTLFSPWYFVSSAAGYNGFIEIRNNTSAPALVVTTVYRDNGTVAGSDTRTIPANGTGLVTANSFVPDGFGSVQIAHQEMPGGIAANITTLSASTGLSFDSPFTPRMSWAMAPF
jgi:hypothetical protein